MNSIQLFAVSSHDAYGQHIARVMGINPLSKDIDVPKYTLQYIGDDSNNRKLTTAVVSTPGLYEIMHMDAPKSPRVRYVVLAEIDGVGHKPLHSFSVSETIATELAAAMSAGWTTEYTTYAAYVEGSVKLHTRALMRDCGREHYGRQLDVLEEWPDFVRAALGPQARPLTPCRTWEDLLALYVATLEAMPQSERDRVIASLASRWLPKELDRLACELRTAREGTDAAKFAISLRDERETELQSALESAKTERDKRLANDGYDPKLVRKLCRILLDDDWAYMESTIPKLAQQILLSVDD